MGLRAKERTINSLNPSPSAGHLLFFVRCRSDVAKKRERKMQRFFCAVNIFGGNARSNDQYVLMHYAECRARKVWGGVLAQKSDLHKALKALTAPIAQKKTDIIAN